MAGKSVGVLSLFINGDAAGLMKEFNKVDRQLARWSQSWTKPGAKLALGFLGVQNALKAIENEVRNVVQNIESIPGVPAETVSSIITMRDNLAAAKNWIDRMTAGIVGFGVKAAQAVGVGAAGLMGYNDASGLGKLESPDQIAAAKDPAFHDKILAARKKLSEVQHAGAVASMDDARQIIELRKQAALYEKAAQSNSANTVEKLGRESDAQEKLNQASAKMLALKKQLKDLEAQGGETMKDIISASSSAPADEKLGSLQQEANAIRFRIEAFKAADQNDPQAIQRQIDARKELEGVNRRIIPLLEKQKELNAEVGKTVASAFEEAIISGRKFSEVLRGLTEDLMRLVFRRQITTPLANWISGGLDKLFTPQGAVTAGAPAVAPPPTGARASGGPVAGGLSYLVGERGPELFVPGGSGSIVPNGATGGGTFYIDARGADRQGLSTLAAAIQRINGSIEPRAVAAIFNAAKRGGSFRRALA